MTTTREAEQATPPKGRLLRAIDAIFAQLWSWGGLYFLIAISLGLALWPLTDIPALKYVVKNDLSIVQRYRALIAIAISLVVTTATYLGIWLRRRRREPGLTLPQSIVETNRWAFVLLLAPMMTALAVPNIETKNQVFTGFLSVSITALAMVFIYRLLGLKKLRPPDDPFVPARWAGAAKGVFWAAFLGYAGLISYFALLDHWNLATTIYDLGIYDNTVWQTAHGFFLDCTFLRGGDHSVAHFDPFLWVIAQIYRVYERAETLLVLQTVWLASGVFPLWLLAKRRLKNEWMAAVLVCCYLLSPALHGINMFDFHSLALIVPNVMWAIYLLDIGGFKRYWLVIAVLLLTREDISLINCFIATYAILIGRTRTGLVTVAVSLAYLVLIKLYAMPDPSLLMAASKGHSYAYYYQEMIPHSAEGAKGLLISLATNPIFALQVLFKEEKLIYLLHLLLPTLALPFVAGRKAVMLVYGALFIGLATRKHVYSLHFHYSSLALPMLFAALPDGLVRVADSKKLRALGIERARLAWTLVLGMLVGATVSSVKYGVIFPNGSFRAGWSRLHRNPSQEMKDQYTQMRTWIEQLGPEASISATSDIGPHISNRRKAYHWPTISDAEYMLLRTQFFKKDDKKRLDRIVKRHKFQLVEAAHGLELYVRDFEAEQAEAEKAKARDEEKKKKAAEAAEAAKAAGKAPPPDTKAEPPDTGGASSGDDEQPVDPHAPPKTEKKPEPPPSDTDGDPAS